MTYRFQMGFGWPIRLATAVAVLMLSMVCANGQAPATTTTTPAVNNPCVQEPRGMDCIFFLVEQLTTKFNTLEQEVNHLGLAGDTNLKFLDKRILALEAKIVTLESQLETMQTRFTAVRKLVGTPPPGGDGKADSVDDIWARLYKIEKALNLRP